MIMVTTPKTAERRHKLRLELIEAAEATLREDGLSAVTARAIASKVGCSVGAIYNVFEDIDGLIIAVNSRTLARLDKQISAFTPDVAGDADASADPESCLTGLAVSYCQFAINHTNAWSALFEHGERGKRDIPDWHLDEHAQLIAHIAKSLQILLPHKSGDETWELAGLLFSAVHGVVSLGLQGFFFAVPQDKLEDQASLLVRTAIAGLKAS
jgi:AcrR family transcriptional regulator